MRHTRKDNEPMQGEHVASRVDPRVKHSRIVLGLWTVVAATTALMYSMGLETGFMPGIIIGSGGGLLVAYFVRSFWITVGTSSFAPIGLAIGLSLALVISVVTTHSMDTWIVAVSVGLVYGTYLWGRFAPRPTSPPLDTFRTQVTNPAPRARHPKGLGRMRIQINAGKWTVSWALVAMLATWVAASVGGWATGSNPELVKPTLVFVLAVALGWFAAFLYRWIEALAFVRALEGGTVAIEPSPSDLAAPAAIFGRVRDKEEIHDYCPYGWVPILLGLGVFCLTLHLLGAIWPTWLAAIALYLVAASVEDPGMRRRLDRDGSKQGRSDFVLFTLVVPAILVAWGTIELGPSTLLGADAFWAVTAGWAGLTAITGWAALYADTPDEDIRMLLIFILGVIIVLFLIIAAAVGWLLWVAPIGYCIGAAVTLGVCLLPRSGPLLDLLPATKTTSPQPCPD